MPVCSQPGCDGLSVGQVLSPTTATYKALAHTVYTQSQPQKPSGEICLGHLGIWFPDKNEAWLRFWVKGQEEKASAIHAADILAADERQKNGVAKTPRLTRGMIIR